MSNLSWYAYSSVSHSTSFRTENALYKALTRHIAPMVHPYNHGIMQVTMGTGTGYGLRVVGRYEMG